jgi:hypothetical protein
MISCSSDNCLSRLPAPDAGPKRDLATLLKALLENPVGEAEPEGSVRPLPDGTRISWRH